MQHKESHVSLVVIIITMIVESVVQRMGSVVIKIVALQEEKKAR